ncbi:MAG: hypothetical protein JO019_04270 [Candidatus Kaiserbacteria bacterium]|nr:hypothetical protein [Candidatus Kaiserbacteria bacterium]
MAKNSFGVTARVAKTDSDNPYRWLEGYLQLHNLRIPIMQVRFSREIEQNRMAIHWLGSGLASRTYWYSNWDNLMRRLEKQFGDREFTVLVHHAEMTWNFCADTYENNVIIMSDDTSITIPRIRA